MFVVSATTLDLTIHPEENELVAVNVEITLTCVSDEGNPTPDITWSWMNNDQNGQLNAFDNTEANGRYNSKTKTSIYKLTTDRALTGRVYKCSIGSSLVKTFPLNVKCMYIIITIC